jgi:hypothetical protein
VDLLACPMSSFGVCMYSNHYSIQYSRQRDVSRWLRTFSSLARSCVSLIFSLSYNSCLAVMVLVVVHRYCLSSDVQLPCVVTASPHRGDGGTPGPAWVLGTAGSSLRSFGRDHVGSHLHTVLGQGFGVARPTSGMQSLERTLLLVMHCIGVASSNGIFPTGSLPAPALSLVPRHVDVGAGAETRAACSGERSDTVGT